jgi:hypothetical protein
LDKWYEIIDLLLVKKINTSINSLRERVFIVNRNEIVTGTSKVSGRTGLLVVSS